MLYGTVLRSPPRRLPAPIFHTAWLLVAPRGLIVTAGRTVLARIRHAFGSASTYVSQPAVRVTA